MYYGASLFTSMSPSFCSWVLLFLNFYDLKTSVEPYRGVRRPNNIVCQIFNEVGGAVRRESATELENPLNLKQKSYWTSHVKFIVFFSIKALISRIQSMLGNVLIEQ